MDKLLSKHFNIMQANISWPIPKLYGVGHFTEFNLYKEALLLAKTKGYINQDLLISEIPQRIKGLVVVESISKTSYMDLIRELLHYKFIRRSTIYSYQTKDTRYKITEEGLRFLSIWISNEGKALDILLEKMQEVFVTPAWFIERLWDLNPNGQGQIVIPLPIKTWHPGSVSWKDNQWNEDLEKVSLNTLRLVQLKIQGSFPYEETDWIEDLKKEYIRLGKQKPKAIREGDEARDIHYSIRNRLSLAMKTVSVKKFFSRVSPTSGVQEFQNKRSDMTHRSFMVWCPRLEKFNMICYTDNNPDIPGRLLYPISAFKNTASSDYECKEFIRNREGKKLYLHTPKWHKTKELFIETLIDVYQMYYDKQSIIYISLQDIRDEVCRQLRISPILFEGFLKKTYEASIKNKIKYSISLETDLRLDMKQQINRRGVYINGIMYSLIAIKPF